MITLDNQKKKKLIITLIILFGTLVVCLLGLLIGAALTNANNSGQSNTSSSSTTSESTTSSEETTSSETSSQTVSSSVSTTVSSSTTSTVSTEGWVTTEISFYPYSIKHPADWVAEITPENPYNDVINLTKGVPTTSEFVWGYSVPKNAFGPYFCFYPDFSETTPQGTYYENYTEIISLKGKVYRRDNKGQGVGGDGRYAGYTTMALCLKSNDGQSFSNLAHITFYSSHGFDPATLSIMDEIVKQSF